MSTEEREDPTTAPDEDVEGHSNKTRDAADEDAGSDDVEGHKSHVRNADDGDDVEGHVHRTR